MKVLVVHNRYSSRVPSGENLVVDEECGRLASAGHEVHTWTRSNDEVTGTLGSLRAAGRAVHSPSAVRGVGEVVDRTRPDVVHVHNTLPLLSPSVVRAATRRGVPVVHTVHNYRLRCVAGTLHRDGGPCGDCRPGALPWPAVRHGCYGGSRSASAAAATSLVVHRRTWAGVTRFLAISVPVRDFLLDQGVAPDRVLVRPNGIPDPGETGPPGRGWVFVGRLEEEKGVRLLLDAWRSMPAGSAPPLTVVGDGPLRAEVEAAGAELPGLTYLGQLEPAVVSRALALAAGVVVPSVWAEGFGRVAVEGMAHGRPVVATRVGALPSLVDDEVGWTCEPSAAALASAVLGADPAAVAARGARGRTRYLARYTPAAALDSLLDAYREAIARHGAAHPHERTTP